MNDCMAPVLEPPAARHPSDTRVAANHARESPALLPLEAVTAVWDYAWFAVEQQGAYCQLV
jgi:hypothetical protein